MTPKQQATCEYLVTYRNPDGSLLLPQFGGCWHSNDKLKLIRDHDGWADWYCSKCGNYISEVKWEDGVPTQPLALNNPNLFTWPNFGILWEAMQAREDWWRFAKTISMWTNHIEDRHINPATFPSTVESYLKGLER